MSRGVICVLAAVVCIGMVSGCATKGGHMPGFRYEESFENLDHWIIRPADHSAWWLEEGKFRGVWQARFNSLCFHRPLEGDASLEVDFRVLPMAWERTLDIRDLPDRDEVARRKSEKTLGNRNFNILWKASGPQGEDFYDAFDEWFGKGKMGLEFFRTYFFTFTYLWGRLRRSPGYELMSDQQYVRSEIGGKYRVRIEQTGARLRYWLNGDLVHDFTDPSPYRRVHLGFVLSTSQVIVSRIVIEAEGAGE